jgi:hypothetical protein
MGNVMLDETKFHISSDPNARTCHTPVLSEAELKANEIETRERLNLRMKNKQPYVQSTVIDVYYHIITCSDGTGSLTDTMLADQMTAMNDAFAGSGFSFVEAGRDVTVNDDWCSGLTYGGSDETNMKQSLRRGDGTALNFYTADLGGGLLGWATFPSSYTSQAWRDGVVNAYGTLPGAGTGAYSLGMTAVHEVGHWLGLFHTFQDGCGTTGDYVADTPEVAAPNYGCPGVVDSCPDDPGNDMTNNFMDYTNDACMDAFTDGQRTRMTEQFNAYRHGSSCPFNCGPPPSATPSVSMSPTPAPTVSPTPAPSVSMAPSTTAELCIDVGITMTDSYGDGWNGNYLFFDSVSNMATTAYKVTLPSGHGGSATLCLPAGQYFPFACGGSWVNEVGWSIDGYGISGGASTSCGPSATNSFTVLAAGTTLSPTPAPTSTNVHVSMTDTFGDGWNGNWLYFDDDYASTTRKVNLPSGSSGSASLYLPPGVYSPFACSGTWDHEVGWTIDGTGISGGADNTCSPSSGSFIVAGDGVTLPPTPVPTSDPTLTPTSAPTQCNVIVDMYDSYGDGWNGNYLYFDSDTTSTTLKMTFNHGHSKTKSICLPPGDYTPFACGGGWPGEVSWDIVGYGISGGASSSCTPNSGTFSVLAEGQTHSPSSHPTTAPTDYPTAVPTTSPTVTVTSSPTAAVTTSPTVYSTTDDSGECCCAEKLDQVLSNQATMMGGVARDSSDASSSSSSSSSSSGQITLNSTSVLVGTVLCATLFACAVVMAVYYRKKVQALEEALGRHSPLGSLELSAY